MYYNNIITPTLLSRSSSPTRSVQPGPSIPAHMLNQSPYVPEPAPVPIPAPAPVPVQQQPAAVPIYRPTINRQPTLVGRGMFSGADMDLMDSILNIFSQPTGTISIFGTTLADNLTPVIVNPSAIQIAESTTVFNATASTNTDQQCTICFENFTDGQELRRINHCEHTFHKTCIDRWFTTNVRCPNCRHDIRREDDGEVENDDEYEEGEEDEYYSSET